MWLVAREAGRGSTVLPLVSADSDRLIHDSYASREYRDYGNNSDTGVSSSGGYATTAASRCSVSNAAAASSIANGSISTVAVQEQDQLR